MGRCGGKNTGRIPGVEDGDSDDRYQGLFEKMSATYQG